VLVALAVAAPATAGGVVLGPRLARGPAKTEPHPTASRCAVSKFEADANLVVLGVGAVRFCRLQAETLSAQGQAWAYRANTRLVAPDSGNPSGLTRICALARGQLTAAVYDDLGRKIGTDLCHAYAASGWELRASS
jgi:hypothetical protein